MTQFDQELIALNKALKEAGEDSGLMTRLRHQLAKDGKLVSGMTLPMMLAACGGAGGGGPSLPPPPPPPPPPSNEWTENPAGTFIGTNSAETATATGAPSASDARDLIVDGRGGDDVITTGSGNDMIRGGLGADDINAGAGDDIIIVVGRTDAGQYDGDAITNPAGSGVDLSSLITLANLNGRSVSEASVGEVIDGGTGNNTLYVYGTVDFTGTTINNVSQVVVNSDVTFTNSQLGAGAITGVTGDGGSILRLSSSSGAAVVINLSDIVLTGVHRLEIGENVTIVATAEELAATGLNVLTGLGTTQISNAVGSVDLTGMIVENTLTITNSTGNAVDSGTTGAVVALPSQISNSDNGVNHEPSDITLSNHLVDENANGGVVGTLKAIDIDSGDNFTYTVSDERFEVVGGVLKLKAGISLDHEAGDVIQLEVTATDDGNLSYTKDFAISVNDLDDPLLVSGVASIDGLENKTQLITSAELLTHITGDAPSISNLTASSGTIADNGNGTWTYTPAPNSHGEVTLSYTAHDGTETAQATATLSIEEITFTIPFGPFEGTVLHFNDPLLPYQSNLLGFTWGQASDVDYLLTPHINLIPVWGEYTGAGVSVMSGELIDYTHPELVNNFVTFDGIYTNLSDGSLQHATSIASVIVAGTDNGIGLAGIAYEATITSQWHVDRTMGMVDIFTISTGTHGTSFFLDYLRPTYALTLVERFEAYGEAGRDGLGTIVIIAVGNYAGNDSSTSAALQNSYFGIVPVGATSYGGFTSGNDFGSGLHITAPHGSGYQNSGTIVADITGDRGYLWSSGLENYDSFSHNPDIHFGGMVEYGDVDLEVLGLTSGDYYSIAGTSFAAPIVVGGVALMLEASTNNIFGSTGLGWRDVQEILAYSSSHTGSAIGAAELHSDEHHPWTVNGANNYNGGGLHFSPDYGFGLLNVHAAVRLAETWQWQHTSSNLVTQIETVVSGASFSYGNPLELSIDVPAGGNLDLDVVTLDLDISHAYWPEVQITLISPDGTESIVFDTPGLDAISFHDNQEPMTGQLLWSVISRAFWGEGSEGVWTIRIEDVVDNGNSGTVNSITANFQGDPDINDDTYIWTDDWAKMNEANGGIPVVDDGVGLNTINAAAVSDDVILDLTPSSTSQIGGVDAFSISATTVIDIGITGDGNDTIKGLDAADSAYGMRGDDRIEVDGSDFIVIDGGAGYDTLALVDDGTQIDFSNLLNNGTVAGFEHIDMTDPGAQAITLTLADVLDMSDTTNTLFIDGGANDSVTLTDQGWVLQGQEDVGGTTYDVYASGDALLYIDQDISQGVG